MFLDLLSLVTDLFVMTDRSMKEGGNSIRLTISASEVQISRPDILADCLDLDYLPIEFDSIGC